MDGNLVELVCPQCGVTVTVAAQDAAGTCPRCGHSLPRTQAEIADGSLIADLREAFAFDADALRSPASCRLTRGAGSSTMFAGSLAADAFPPGSRLGDFEIRAELGRGGMGIVYRARQVSLDREVALKVLPGYARHGPTAVQRFRTEAQAAARLHHTNIVPIYAQGEQDGHCYYAMELVDGVGLDTLIHRRPELLSSTLAWRARATAPSSDNGGKPALTVAKLAPTATPENRPAEGGRFRTREEYQHLAALMAEVAEALECAHQHGVIHRDVKPHNLLLGKNHRLHLTDFGLARLTDQPHLTISGEVMGTPAYLSPEQIRGDISRIDQRTDIYSLGVTLYELLTRRKPFDGKTREQIISGICTTEPTSPRRLNPQIPIDLETICLRAMEKEPRGRYSSAGLLAEDLRRFAAGRRILSRRASAATKTARWVRRHKVLATASAAVIGACVLSAVLAWSADAARQREARRLLRDAYAQLAYFDYRAPELVAADIDRAADLGADAQELHLVRALASLGAADEPTAIQHLEAALEVDARDLRLHYLLAWAHWRSRELAAARAVLDEATRLGPPKTADAWFFRGLAIHYADPLGAIESYRQANALRAREQAFYPQAVLHLARARNQRMYATRSLDGFPEADASLRQLIEHQQYGVYPYYLLSIAHRLAAEIYSGSQGTRDDSLVAEHYAQALEWARRGQQLEPDNDRAITAEAECLESMGRFAEAIEARTRAIGVAEKSRARCEGYHYRWRLRYWIGELTAALDDVAVHAECDPQSRFYAHVYPALILAETGQMPAALEHARALVDEGPDNAQAVLWSATCLRLLGQPDEAQALLVERANAVDFAAELVPPQSEEWVRALYATCLDRDSLAALETLAEQTTTPWKLWGEAHFHAAARRLSLGDRAGALQGFARAYRSFDSEERYTYQGKLIYQRMQTDPTWPPWIPPSDDDFPGAAANPDTERTVGSTRAEEGADR
jgi:hypothetical protein